jgi:hypothetical protein
MNRRPFKFDEHPRVKMKVEDMHAIQLNRSEFLGIYGEILYQKYHAYCNNLSNNSYDSYVPYMKVIFSKRHTSKKSMVSQHIIEHEVLVSEIETKKIKIDTAKTITQGEMTVVQQHRPKRPNRITKRIDSVSSVKITESTQEVSREVMVECVPIARLDKVVYCDIDFQDSSKDVGCQTLGSWCDAVSRKMSPTLSIGSTLTQNIQPTCQDIKLESVMTSSIGIQSFDSYINISEPKKPMYRHIHNKMGLGRLCERNETVRELWMTQEILSLKSQMRELIESQDSLIMSGRLLDIAPMTSDDSDTMNMQSIMNQVADLMSDPEVSAATEAYFG